MKPTRKTLGPTIRAMARGARSGVGLLAVSLIAMLVFPSTGFAAGRPAAKSTKRAKASKAKKPFVLDLCYLINDVSALHISDPCVQHSPITYTSRTPAGAFSSQQWIAQWGKPGSTDVDHSLFVTVGKVQASGAALAIFQKETRAEVLARGAPVVVGDLASLDIEDLGCRNPPTNDCVHANLEVIAGQYHISILLSDGPPTVAGPDANGSSEPDDSEDQAFHETLQGPLIGIGIVIVAKLQAAG